MGMPHHSEAWQKAHGRVKPLSCATNSKRSGTMKLSALEANEEVNHQSNQVIEWGCSIPCDFDNKEQRQLVMSLLINTAQKTLTAGSVFEIRAKPYPPESEDSFVITDYGRTKRMRRDIAQQWGMAWLVSENGPCPTKTEPLIHHQVD